MRRSVPVLLATGFLLLTASACGTSTNSGTPSVAAPAPGGAGASGAAAPPPAAAPPGVQSTCEALGKAYGKNMAPFAESLTKLVADRKAVAQAKGSLAAFATAVEEATKASDDAQLRSDGKQAATRMQKASTDDKFFGAIKSAQDVDKTMGTTLTEWLSPVNRHCS